MSDIKVVDFLDSFLYGLNDFLGDVILPYLNSLFYGSLESYPNIEYLTHYASNCYDY